MSKVFLEKPLGLDILFKQITARYFLETAPDAGIRGTGFMDRIERYFVPGDNMHLFRETFLLFSLNLLDAMLTIIWVRNGVADEGNQLMARLLESGDLTFLTAKIAIGTITAFVLLRWGNRRLARYGLTVALAVYISLMGIHVMTGLSAFGYFSQRALYDLSLLSGGLLAMIV